MGRLLDRMEQLAFAQLVDLAQYRAPVRFPANGSFVASRRGGNTYWYYQGYEPAADGAAGTKTRTYVGPVGDVETDELRAAHVAEHRRYRERRRIAASLRRLGLPAPLRFDGAVLDALQKAGVFEAGGVLVGSMAYQAYSGLIGVKLDDSLMQTGGIDIAQRGDGSMRVARSMQTSGLQALLTRVDPSFAPIFDRGDPGRHLGYINGAAYKIEFLTTMKRRRAGSDSLALPGMDNVSAQPMPYIEFLLENSARSIVLHDDGIPVTVPSPARYAVHKLIVAVMRERVADTKGIVAMGSVKIRKDVAQAAALMSALHAAGGGHEIGVAWEDAWRRGPKWREHLRRGKAKLDSPDHALLEDLVMTTRGPAAWPK